MLIDIANLTKTYRSRVRALDGIDLDIPTGMFGLLGANGAGKTTLMRILAGLLAPTSGHVHVGAHNMSTATGRAASKRVLGYLPQEMGVYPDLSGREFLDYLGLLKRLDDTGQRRRRVAELLDTVALTEVADRKLKTYSGGMKRRIGIAQALLNDPQLLIVDEPTAGLDPEERIRFRTLLARLAEQRTVLLSTHIVEDIAQTCRELAVLDHGHLIFRGTVTELIAAAADHVWSVSTPGPAPATGTIVSAVAQADGHQHYRLVAAIRPTPDALPVAPTLEDGYIALKNTVQTSSLIG